MRKFYLLLLNSLCFFYGSFAQPVIDSTAGGGFESGNTLALNGWTVVNSPLDINGVSNTWEVGNATKYKGARSAYISDDAGVNNTYDKRNIHISHFYQDVLIPSGVSKIVLSFYLQGNGEGSSDHLIVYTDLSLTDPVADALPGGSATPVFNQSAPSATYTLQSITLPVGSLAGNTVRIIFTWENDGNSMGSDPPASVDNISLDACTAPAIFNVTGTGGYCTGAPGLNVGLSNSESGVSYQLMNGASPVGTPLSGTGSSLDFGVQTAGNYTVVATSGTCTSNMNGSAVITENPLPTVSAGSDFTITCTLNPSGAAIGETNDPSATYSWAPTAGLSSSTASNPIADPAITTTYTVTKTVTATGCTNTASVTVTVNNSATSVSAGSPFTITCTAFTGGAAIGEPNDPTATYSWTPAAGLSSSTASNPNANPATTTTYTVTKTITATGCTATASVTVTVNNTPPTVSAGSPFTITCTAFTGGSTIGEPNDPTATYSWSPTAGLSSSTVSNPNANPATTTTYTVTKTITATGCTNAASVTVTVSNSAASVSAGSPFTITCTAFTGGSTIGESNDPAATYSWTPTAGLSSSTVSNPNANPATTTTYTVTKTITATGCIASASVTVTVNNTSPTVSAGSPFTKTCVTNTGGAAIGEPNDPTATYSWTPALGLSSTSVSNPNANPTTTTTYTVTKTITATGCTNTASVLVTVDNTPPTVSAGSPFTKTCTLNTSGGIIGESNDPTATYSWNPTTGLTPSATVSNPNANPATTTTYTVTKTSNANGCTSTASVTVTVDNTVATVSAGNPFTKTCVSNTGGAAIGEPNDPTAAYSWTPALGLSSTTVSNPNANPAATTTYTVTKTITSSGCTNSASVTVTVDNTPPTVSAGSPFTKTCTTNTTGGPIGEPNDPTATYSWSPAAGLSSTTASNPNANPTTTTTYTVTKTGANGCTNTASVVVTVDNTPPTVSAGSPFTKTCTSNPSGAVIGEPNDPTATYSWSPAAGLSSTTVSNPTANPAATTTYTVTKTTTTNGCSNSGSVIVTVDNSIPVATVTGSSALCLPATTTVSPTTGGTWVSSDNSVATVTNAGLVTGVSGGTVTFTFTQTSTGCSNTTSSVTVSPTPTVNKPADQAVCKGAPVAVNFSGSVPGTTYNWTNDNTSIGLAASGSGNIASFSAVNIGSTILTANVTVTPTINGCTGTAQTFTITVDPTPTIVNPGNQILCNGTLTAGITLTGAVTGTIYNWNNSAPSIGLPASGSGDIASFTATNAGTTNVVATITVTPKASGCGGTPITFTITVKPTPTVNPVSNQTVCNGTTTAAVNFTGAIGGTVYNWTNDNTATGLASSGSGNIPAISATNAGAAPITSNVTVTPTFNGCPGTPTTFTITVNPSTAVNTPPNQNLCNGTGTAAVTFTGGVAGTIYNWTNTASSIGLAASGAGNIASFTAANAGSTQVTATITVIPTANGCPGPSAAFTITVKPTPTVTISTPTPANQTVCNGASTAAVTFTGAITPGTTYNWVNNTPSIGLLGSGTSNIAAFTAVNAGATPVTATITVTPTANGCDGTPTSFTITVNPTASVVNPGPQIVCKGAPATINFTGTAGATFNWTNDNTAIGLAASGSGNLSFTALNDTSIAKIAHISVTPTASGCPGATINFTITVNPSVTITGNTMAGQGCTNTGFIVTPVDSVNGVVPAGTTFSWGVPVVTGGMTGGAAGSGASITGTLVNPTTTAQTATYTVNSTSGTCVGTPFTLVVTIYPNPTKQIIDFFQTNVYSQQLCIGAQVGGGGQNDLDIEYQNGPGLPAGPQGGQPPNLSFDNGGFDWVWEYATGNPTGPTVPFVPSPGTTGTHYQFILPPVPSVFSPIGDYWWRFALTKNGCTSYSDSIHLQVTSTLIAKAGGPFVRCAGGGAFALAGSSITGTSTTTISGQWSIFSGGGTLSNTSPITTGNAAISAVTYTPAVGFTGTAKLVLKSNDPDGAGVCQPAADTAYVILLPLGNLQGCTAPANWQLVNTNGNGSLDNSQVPCAASLIGSDNASGTTGTTDFKICSGAGNFSFNWVYTAPATGGPTPVWHTADQTTNAGAGTNRGSFVAIRPTNVVAGDLIIVILHARDNVGSIATLDGFSSIRNDVSGNSGSSNRGAIYTYWKIATAAEPATYSFQANSMATNDDWVAVAGRITGADPTNPIDISNGTNSNSSSVTSIIDPSITTLGSNRLLIQSISIGDDDHGASIAIPTPTTGISVISSGNSGLGKQITYGDYFQNFPTAGTTSTETFSWSASDPAATQVFAIKPAPIPDDSAFVIVNGVQTLISGVSGTQGTFSIPVNTNDVIGYRIKTTANTGGPGKLTFYNVTVPNDSPKVSGVDTIVIATCNPANPQSFFVTPTATDNCNAPVIISTVTGSVVTSGTSSSQTRTWIFADNCGLQSKPFTQTIKWSTAPPVITCPATPQNLCSTAGNYTIPPLVVNTSSGPATTTYSITGATTRSGSGNDASGPFSSGTSTINWTVSDAYGCSTLCSTTVNIAPGPVATLTGNATTCSGASTNITVNFSGTPNWSITYFDGTTSTPVSGIAASPYIFSVSPTVNTTYTLTGFSDSRCNGTFSGSAVITVKPKPTAAITVSGLATICSGSSTTLSIAPTGTAPWTITYTDGVTPVTIPNIMFSPYTFTVSPTVTTTYTITAVSDAGCVGVVTGSPATVTVSPKPTITVSPSAASICVGGSTSLTASGASTYSWSPATGLSSTNAVTVVANPTVTTTYTVTGTDAGGCVNTATVTVTVNTPPVTTGVTICQGGAGTISSSTVCAGGTFTTGPNNAGAAVDTIGQGTIAWSNPGFITTPGTPYATAAISTQTTHYLKATHYGFAIPAGSTITGVTVTINESCTGSSTNVTDNRVQLVMAGAIVGNNLATGTQWPAGNVFAAQTYGGAVTLWVPTLTPGDINDPNFGVALSAKTTGGSRTLEVDYMQITVTYTLAGALNWFTVSSGGTSFGSGTPFNPVGVAGSGLPNTNTPGTSTFYAECSTAPGCRTGTDFIINGTTAGGSLSAPVPVCTSTTGTLTLSGNVGSVVRWESFTNGGPWVNIANTTTSLNYTATAQTTLYRALVQNGTCSSVYSTVDTVGIHNVWTGVTSTDWFTGSNWSDGMVPTATPCLTVTIPQVTAPAVYPIISSGTATITNLVINANATATVLGTGLLQIAGAITNNGTFDVSNGRVEFNSTSASQNIATGTFTGNRIHDLVISNSTAGGVNLAGPLDVLGSLTYGTGGTQFVTNNNLTLKSTATGTAWVGDMTGHSITGNVMVERYIPARKAWRFLSVPTQPSQNIHAAWQEGQAADAPTPSGLGTQITSDIAPTVANGFDLQSLNGPSMKTYNPATNDYTGILSTNAPFAPALGGYMTFIRGDRTANTFASPVTSTVLRTKGALYTGPQPPINVVAGQITPCNNPYASPLDLRKISQSLSVFFYVWDPNRGGAYGYGAFQTLSWNGTDYTVVPGGSSSYPGNIDDFIESGQAFLVSGGTTSLALNETKKGPGSGQMVFRPAAPLTQQLRSDLYSVNADSSSFLADGVLDIFDDSYSNNIDALDARKMTNFGENLAIRRAGTLLVLERRHTITQQDTIFLNLTGVRVQQYQFRFEADNINTGVEGFLEDTYLHTRTPLNLKGSTVVNFNIENIAGSYAPDGFRLVFAPSVVLQVTFTSVKAYPQDKNINVEWRVENEMNMKQYEVEKSTNGTQFTTLAIIPATGNGMPSAAYVTTDANPVQGYNYYRIKSVDENGKTTYTSVVKVLIGTLKHDITINPNPITDGIIRLQFVNQPQGRYGIRLLNNLGQIIMSKQINHPEGSSTELINWDYNLAHGIYQLEITKPDGGVKNIKVLY